MALDLNEFHGMFFEESFEALDEMESGLLSLDVDAEVLDLDTINTIFRGAHSVKGGSGMFGFTEVTGFTHILETLLDKVRDGGLRLSLARVDVMLQAVDCLREMLQATQVDEVINEPRVVQMQSILEELLVENEVVTPVDVDGVRLHKSTIASTSSSRSVGRPIMK